MRIDYRQANFDQHHQGYRGQKFALIRVFKCLYANTYHKGPLRIPTAYVLILESTGEQKIEYRRLGLLSVRPEVTLLPNHSTMPVWRR